MRYKLDAGIDHILVDERQDTNPEQWQVVRALIARILRSAPAPSTGRARCSPWATRSSRSISFQGAEPELFVETGGQYRLQRHEAACRSRSARAAAHTSFRTLPEILEGGGSSVQRPPDLQDGAARGRAGRITIRRAPMRGGSVTLWPPVSRTSPTRPTPTNWPLEPPLDRRRRAPRARWPSASPARSRAGSTPSGPLGPRGRAVRADDVLILVQSRGVAVPRNHPRPASAQACPTPGRRPARGHRRISPCST